MHTYRKPYRFALQQLGLPVRSGGGGGANRTFLARFGVRRQRDVIQLSQTEPFSIHRHPEFAQIDGFHGSLGDLVCGGSRRIALRRQRGHDDSADTTIKPILGGGKNK